MVEPAIPDIGAKGWWVMSRAVKLFGRPKFRSEKAPITNKDGYPAWKRPVRERALQCLTTNTFGNTYYATSKELVDEAKEVCEETMKTDTQFAARAIVYARNAGYMRTQPIYWLARLAEYDGELFETIFPQVIRTPNDLRDFATIMHDLRGGEGGRRIKRVAGQWLLKLSEYWTIKYGSDNKEGYSLRDMLCVYHPNAGKKVPLFDYIMGKADIRTKKGNVRRTLAKALPQITFYEMLKSAKTTEEKVMAITEGRLPHEVATSFAGSDKAVWDSIVPQMPIFALLRNLATLERHDVLAKHRTHIIKTLTNEKVIRNSKILPFRFMDAMDHVTDARVRDALREACDLAFINIPDIEGKTAVMLDISGSMGDGMWDSSGGKVRGGYIRPGALFGVSAMRKANLDGEFLLFDTAVTPFAVSMRDSVLSQAMKIQVRGGTDTGVPIRYLLENKRKVDNIVMVTDEVQNVGTPFVNLLDQYRAKINRNVKTFILNVAAYEGSMVPPHDDNTYYIYGWSPTALSFISMATKGWGTMVETVQAMSLTNKAVEQDVDNEG